MTPKDTFINQTRNLFADNDLKMIIATPKNGLGEIQMTFDNPQDDELIVDFVKIIGFTRNGDFCIKFEDENYGEVYEDDLDHNSQETWEKLWNCIHKIVCNTSTNDLLGNINALKAAHTRYENACKTLSDTLTKLVEFCVQEDETDIEIPSTPIMVDNSFTGEPQLEYAEFLNYEDGKAVVECESGNSYQLYELSDYDIARLASNIVDALEE